ncbi:MAG: nuclear transport factor 2 family protein [Sphingomonadales bacterium]|nr:nuclear transport factor 2 family protein [Sphingomonadales bacterium]MDE2168818.1 nuclear transport factor 2 family protein [Sphingomonadales bacterium]
MNQTLALIERYYTAFNVGDREAVLTCLTENVAHDINQGERQTGKAAFAAFLAHMDRCYAEQLADITIMATPDGKRAAAEFVVHGQYLATDEGLPEATGQRYILPAGAFFTIENGLIARVSVYYNLPDWTRQVGGRADNR